MTKKAGEKMNEKDKPKKVTDMEGLRLVAKGLLSSEIYDTEYAPLIISHPFANSGIVFLPGKNGQEMLDAPCILFACLLFTLTAPLYIWSILE